MAGGTLAVSNGTVNLGGTFIVANLGTVNRSGGSINIIGTLNNSNTTFSLDATTGSWGLAGGTIHQGTVAASGGAKLLGLFGSSASTLDGVTLNSDLDISAGSAAINVIN